MKRLFTLFLISGHVIAYNQCPTQVPTVQDTCVVGASSVVLNATGSTGNYAWYDALTGGDFLGNGSCICNTCCCN